MDFQLWLKLTEILLIVTSFNLNVKVIIRSGKKCTPETRNQGPESPSLDGVKLLAAPCLETEK